MTTDSLPDDDQSSANERSDLVTAAVGRTPENPSLEVVTMSDVDTDSDDDSVVDTDLDLDDDTDEDPAPSGDSEPEDSRGRPSGSPRRVVQAVRQLVQQYELQNQRELPQVIAVLGPERRVGVTTIARALAEVATHDNEANACYVDLSRARSGGTNVPTTADDDVVTVESIAAPQFDTRADGAGFDVLDSDAIAADVDGGLNRAELQRMFRSLKNRYDFIVVDSPSPLQPGRPLIALRHSDAYVLVSRYGSTSPADIEAAVASLTSVEMVGAVLNGYGSRTPRFLRRFFGD